MIDAERRMKLESQVKRGSMADIATKETLGEFVATQRESLISTMIGYYREGKHGAELLALLGELSALDKLKNDLRMKVENGKRAFLELEGGQTNDDAEQYSDY